MIVKTIIIHDKKINITDYVKTIDGVEHIYYRARITTFYDSVTHTQKQKTLNGTTIAAVEEQVYQAFNASSVIPRYNSISTTIEEAVLNFVNMRYRGRTKSTYLSRCKNYIIPEIGDILVQKLTQAKVQELADMMDDDGYQPTTINGTISVLRVCMNEYVHRGEIPFNPCMDVRLPRPVPSRGIALTAEQLTRLLTDLIESPYYLFINILAMMALRVSECRGLTWDKIHYTTKTITIDQQFPIGSDIIKHSVKNNNPTTLSYDDGIFEILDKVKEQQEKYKREAGENWNNPNDLVFTTESGSPIPYNQLRLTFKKAATKIGIPELRMHDLRHTYASHLWEETHEINLVSLILRHTNTNTTRVYIHPTEQTLNECLALRNKVAAKLFHPSIEAVSVPKAAIPSRPATVASMFDPFLDNMMDHNLSYSTIVSRTRFLKKHLFNLIGTKTFDEVTAEDIISVYDKIRADGLSGGSLYGAYATMQVYFKFAISKGVTDHNPVYDAGIIPHS